MPGLAPWQQAIDDRDRRWKAALRASRHLFEPVVQPEAPKIAAGIFYPNVKQDADVLRIATKTALDALQRGFAD